MLQILSMTGVVQQKITDSKQKSAIMHLQQGDELVVKNNVYLIDKKVYNVDLGTVNVYTHLIKGGSSG